MSDLEYDDESNDQLVLISGYSGTGKSFSLRNLRNPEKWLYEITEAGKRPPFKSRFITNRVHDPMDILDHFDEAIDNPDLVDGIIVDSLNFTMDQYESTYVINSANTQKAWGDYNQFFKELMQKKVVLFNKPVIFTAHVFDMVDEQTQSMITRVPVKGALAKTSVESFFSTIVYARKMRVKDLMKFENDMLNITEEEQELGYKHVFQTRITKDTIGDKIRSPHGLFERNETFIDNDAQILLDRLTKFYA